MRAALLPDKVVFCYEAVSDRGEWENDLVTFCKSYSIPYKVPKSGNQFVIVLGNGDPGHQLGTVEKWCKRKGIEFMEAAQAKRHGITLVTAAEYVEPEETKPLAVVEQRKPFDMWVLWYSLVQGRFPKILRPKKPLKRELGMMKTLLDSYDDHVVERIMKTAVDGWHVLMAKHRGISEIPTLELVSKFAAELQAAADGGGLTSNTHRAPTGPDAAKAYDDWKK